MWDLHCDDGVTVLLLKMSWRGGEVGGGRRGEGEGEKKGLFLWGKGFVWTELSMAETCYLCECIVSQVPLMHWECHGLPASG